jgi:hypothetical protein
VVELKMLGQSLNHNTVVKHLLMPYTGLTTAKKVTALLASLQDNHTLAALNLGENNMKPEAYEVLIQFLTDHPVMQSVYLTEQFLAPNVLPRIQALLTVESRERRAKALHLVLPPPVKVHHTKRWGRSKPNPQP